MNANNRASIPDAGSDSLADYSAIVEDTFRVIGRGVLVCTRVTSGSVPPVGAAITIVSGEGQPVKATITGRPTFDAHISLPEDHIYLSGMTTDDVPIGARITLSGDGA